jgi:hypothetical protein
VTPGRRAKHNRSIIRPDGAKMSRAATSEPRFRRERSERLTQRRELRVPRPIFDDTVLKSAVNMSAQPAPSLEDRHSDTIAIESRNPSTQHEPDIPRDWPRHPLHALFPFSYSLAFHNLSRRAIPLATHVEPPHKCPCKRETSQPPAQPHTLRILAIASLTSRAPHQVYPHLLGAYCRVG